MSKEPVIAWWSGGITSAVACKLALDFWDNVRIVFMDTHNEDDDTYRFKDDCEKWYGAKIETISRPEYDSIEEVWLKFTSLNVAHGAICSSELKRDLRISFLKENDFRYNVFGFDIGSFDAKRARSMAANWPEIKPFFPLLALGISKKQAIDIVKQAGIEIPRAYHWGFNNNNCLKTGCIQGGIGYWQKMKAEWPEKFDKMATMEHDLTNKKGKPVTILKDQSKGGGLVFLKPHPDYPTHKDISMMKGRQIEPLIECNGFCGTNDLI